MIINRYDKHLILKNLQLNFNINYSAVWDLKIFVIYGDSLTTTNQI
jgi:hypothetical protein